MVGFMSLIGWLLLQVDSISATLFVLFGSWRCLIITLAWGETTEGAGVSFVWISKLDNKISLVDCDK
jgi:hypothetical protein